MDKNFFYGAGAVAVIWWFWRHSHPCPCDAVANPTATASQTIDSAGLTVPGGHAILGGLLPAVWTRPPVPSNPRPRAELRSAVDASRKAQTAPMTVAPGPVNLFASGGRLPRGTVGSVGPRVLVPPTPSPMTWNIG
jgi:hypothetical protein